MRCSQIFGRPRRRNSNRWKASRRPKDGRQIESSDRKFMMFNEVQQSNSLLPQVLFVTPFRSLTESSGTILTSERGMDANIPNLFTECLITFKPFALKQARHSPMAGSTRSGGALLKILEILSVPKRKCKWRRAEVQEVVITW